MINASEVWLAESRSTEYLPALNSLPPTMKSNGMFALTLLLRPANPIIDTETIRVSAATMLSIFFFKIISIWYQCSVHNLPLLIVISKRCAWHPFSCMCCCAYDSPPNARRNGDVSNSALLDVYLRVGRSQPIDD